MYLFKYDNMPIVNILFCFVLIIFKPRLVYDVKMPNPKFIFKWTNETKKIRKFLAFYYC